jgi:hypothetical protein
MISKGGQHAPNWVRPRPAPKSKKQTQYLLKGSRCAELVVEIRPGLEGSECSELSTIKLSEKNHLLIVTGVLVQSEWISTYSKQLAGKMLAKKEKLQT